MDASTSGQIYAELGYDFLAITDHNNAHNPEQWQEWQAKTDLLIVPGEETGNSGHILELGIQSVTRTESDFYIDRAKQLRQAGGFIVGCHPQEYPDHGEEDIRSSVEYLHGFEILNGLRESRGCDENANVKLWDQILTNGDQIWGVATDDFHCAYITPGHGWVMVQIPENTPTPIDWQIVVEQLKKGAFYASTYPSFEKIEFHDESPSNQRLIVTAKRARSLQIIGDGGIVLHKEKGNQLEWSAIPHLTYFRIEAISGIKRSWSQPFYCQD